jgi:enterochelin esterase-like enzyme
VITKLFTIKAKQIWQLLLNTKLALFGLCFSAVIFVGCDKTKPHDNPPIFNRYAENVTFFSKILNRDVTFALYFPDDYTITQKRYGTVYLLHGWGDDQTAWVKGGNVNAIINDLEAKGAIDSYIYVMPYALKSYYVNYYTDKYNYMDMFANELVPYIDSLYRTKAKANYRVVVGYSMGGYGAMILPYKHPEIFSISVPLSMSWRTHEQYGAEPQSVWDGQFGRIFGGEGLSGEARLTDYYLQHDPLTFFENLSEDQKKIKLWMDCGDDEEQLSVTAVELHALLQKNQIPHNMRIRNGAHTWDYWHQGIREALPFITRTMNGISEPEITEATDFAKVLSGDNQEVDMSGCALNITRPQKYNQRTDSCHVVYLAYDSYQNRVTELQKIGLLLDSLQVDKNFILVAFDAAQLLDKSLSFDALVDYINTNYRTKKKSYHRLIIGNNECGEWVYNSANIKPSITHAVYLFNAKLSSQPALPTNEFYYLSAGDKSNTCSGLSQLYIDCRKQGIDHQYRILNGNDSFETFLYLLQESIPHIGLKLNKF